MTPAASWPLVPLPDAFWFQEGPGVRKWQFTTQGIKLLNVANIEKSGTLNLAKTNRHLDKTEIAKKYSHFLVDSGDLVIASSGITFAEDGLLRTRGAFVRESDLPLCLNTSTIRFKPKNGLSDLRFLRHWLDSLEFRSQITKLVTGTAQQNFGPSHLNATKITLPPLAEQRRIAASLDEAEALRAKRRGTLAQSEILTQSIFLDLFGNPVSNERHWPLRKVGEVGRVQLGRQRAPQYQSGRYTRPYVRVANVYEDRLDLSDVLSMDFDEEDFRAYRLEHKDILLNEGQSTELVGRPAMWRDEVKDCCFQNTLVRFQAKQGATIPEFAFAVFLHYFRSGEFAKVSSKTSNVAHLGAGRFAAMPFPLPPIPLQSEFARRMLVADNLKKSLRDSLAKLDALFSSIQHRAFRGEL